MKSKPLGSSGVQVPELALGTWQYRAGVESLHAGIELGASFIDTAESYGTESMVASAIRGIRDRVFLATKISPRHFRQAEVIRAAECSLKQLGTDYLDLYQLHWPNYAIPVSETMEAMERLVESGKVRFIGVSNFTLSELRKAQSTLRSSQIVSNQVRYSLVDRLPEEGLLDYCEATHVSLLAYSPLATSLVSLRAADPEDILGQVAAATGKTRAQVALAWCLSHAPVIAIFKADKVEHVRENCAASGWELAPEHRQLLERGIQHRSRSRPERFLRRMARRALQYSGRNLGKPTAADRLPHSQSTTASS